MVLNLVHAAKPCCRQHRSGCAARTRALTRPPALHQAAGSAGARHILFRTSAGRPRSAQAMAANTSEDELSPLMSSSAQGSRQQADGAQGSTQRKQGRGSSLSRAHSGPRVFRPMEAPEVCAALSVANYV